MLASSSRKQNTIWESSIYLSTYAKVDILKY